MDNQPIAIIGMGCRLPGDIFDLHSFWKLLSEQREAISEIPTERWDVNALYDEKIEAAGKMCTRWGGFLKGVDLFDAHFFGISPLEAESMDPQQRILLEVVWEALEHANIVPTSLKGSKTSVFVGSFLHDYDNLLSKYGNAAEINSYRGIGNTLSAAAGRISYQLGLHGPSIAIDTASSASLVAVHTACQNLRDKECNLSIVGGVNIILTPETTISFSKAHMLSPEGHCKSFDADADGYVRSEGCGVVILKRLADALHDKDHILAVIEGSAINQDGASNGLTAPSAEAQEEVIQQALAASAIERSEIDYIEAHGSGTPLGDPTEFMAINRVFGHDASRSHPLIVGSVKANLGHLEAASGIIGLIKVVLSLQHGQIPAQLNFHTINSKIDLHAVPCKIPLKAALWEKSAKKRHAGVSSFGFTGTNAHLIVSEAPPAFTPEMQEDDNERPLHLICLSAKSDIALESLVNRYQKYCSDFPQRSLADLAFTANTCRTHFPHRLAIAAKDLPSLRQQLLTGKYQQGSILNQKVGKVAFLCSGHLSGNIGKELYESHPTFRSAIDECAEHINIILETPLQELIFESLGPIPPHEIQTSQLCLFAIQYALGQLWKSFGIVPDFVMGYGDGEIAAACIAGALPVTSALHLIANRGRQLEELLKESAQSGMAEINADADRVQHLLAQHPAGSIKISALNTPQQTLISGLCSDLEEICAVAQHQGFRCKISPEPLALHSPLVDPILPKLLKAEKSLTYQPLQHAMISTASGKQILNHNHFHSSYWQQHATTPINFLGGIEQLRARDVHFCIELGSDSTLLELGKACLPNSAIHWIPSSRTSGGNWELILAGLADLYCAGYPVDWESFDAPYHRKRIFIPLYPFQRQRYWLDGASPPPAVAGNIIDQTRVNRSPENPQAAAPTAIKMSRKPSHGEVEKIRDFLAQTIRSVMKLPLDYPLDESQRFFALGMDSLMVANMLNALQDHVGEHCPLPATAAFDYPSIDKLSHFISESLIFSNLKGLTVQGNEQCGSRSPTAPLSSSSTAPAKPPREAHREEPIAIIGISCRFPGGANDPESFWQLMSEQRDAVSEVPKDRWDADAYYSSDRSVPGKICTRYGAFLDLPIDQFDAGFFHISPREAELMDPQQRLLLEVTWEALEAACIAPDQLQGSSTAVFIGASNRDYLRLLDKAGEHISNEAYISTGNSLSIAAGRISYTLGLQGANLSIDTACSSSLVALHQACQSLRHDECSLAIAGGVNLVLCPEESIQFSQAKMLAPDGHCKTFDSKADGYVRGEGCGIVILKRLSDAIKDGDCILAQICSSGINQDGASSGLTVPNGKAQEALMSKVLQHSGYSCSDVDYVEAHGTGTALGDPIEVRAIGAVYGKKSRAPLILGSVKTNIGHLEAAAGIAGVIKVVLALQHQTIPAHLNFNTLNPRIELDSISAKIPVNAIAWPSNADSKRVAAVSSFGFSGTNAHVVLAEAPLAITKTNLVDRPLHLISLSALDDNSLQELVDKFHCHLSEDRNEQLSDIAYSANTGRAQFKSRLAIVAATKAELLHKLASQQDCISSKGVEAKRKLLFIFGDSGSEYPQMGGQLYATQPTFKAAIEECTHFLNPQQKAILQSHLHGTAEIASPSTDSRLLLFAVQYALAKMWLSWGVLPDHTFGVGIGKYVAAVIDCTMTLQDALEHCMDNNRLQDSALDAIDNLQTLLDEKPTLLAISPCTHITEIGLPYLPHEDGSWLPSLSSKSDEWTTILNSLAQLYVKGYSIDWKGFDAPYHRRKVLLPTYPFQRERYWAKSLDKKRADELIRIPASWYFELQWQKVQRSSKLTALAEIKSVNHWLILADAGSELAQYIHATLTSQGCIAEIFPLDEIHMADISAWLEAHQPAGIMQCYTQSFSADIPQATEAACHALLSLHRHLHNRSLAPRWVLIAQLGQIKAPHASPISAESAILGAAIGLFKTIQIEAPQYQGLLIDVDVATEETAAHIAHLAQQEYSENQWALREGSSYVPRIVSAIPPEPKKFELDIQGSYLVTGGMGGIGFHVAKWLVSKGCRRLILVGRHAPNAEKVKQIAAWAKEGIAVELSLIDIGDRKAVEEMIASIDPKAPLKGVFHAAGTDHRALLEAQTDEQLQAILRAKVAGSCNLHLALQQRHVDFIVYFSSAAALLGSPRQGPYAAANSFMDCFAEFQRGEGIKALNFQWGFWAETGLGAYAKQLRGNIEPEQGMRALEELLANGTTTIAVISPETLRFMLDFAPKPLSAWFEALAKNLPKESSAPSHAKEAAFWQHNMRQLPIEKRSIEISQLILRSLCEVLGFTDPSKINRDGGFFDLGLDSIMAVELKSKLSESTAMELNASIVFDYPSVNSLTEALIALLAEKGALEIPKESHTASPEAIAVIGMSCVFPGAEDLEAFWKLLDEEREALRPIPQSRWRNETYYASDPNAEGKSYVGSASFIDNVEYFDPSFFNISPKEAELIDPQQRLFLEQSWRALEHAAIAPESLKNSRTGVFAGVAPSEYGKLLEKTIDSKELNAYITTGNAVNVISGRVSFTLGLRGPCLAIDTACSSALVAIHEACQSLKHGECDLALAGGVNVMLMPEMFITLSKGKMLSPDGRCKTFDASADGYGRGEGCGVIVLKRLSDAQSDNDRILGIISGSGVNQDGASSGLTVPNGEAQESLLREVASRADVDPKTIDYFEAHGTGTSLGDPIEVSAIGRVYSQGREKPLTIGTVKTNIGHLESAAGVAGMIKVILSLVKEKIPKHLHFQKLNPHIDLSAIPAAIPRQAVMWKPQEGHIRRGAINSFGFSGTNAHAIVEEAPHLAIHTSHCERPIHIIAFSSRTDEGLHEQIERYQRYLDENPHLPLADIAYTANGSRLHFNLRASCIASSTQELAAKIKARDFLTGETALYRHPKVTFLFSDYGSQYSGMGKQLYESHPIFKASIDQCSEFLAPFIDRALPTVLFEEPHLLDQPLYGQPALFSLEYALTKLWYSFGVIPSSLIGCGLGEYVAAVVAGVMSLQEALKLVAARAAFIQNCSHCDSARLEFRKVAEAITYLPPTIALISTVTAKEVGAETIDAEYWVDHFSKPVQFDATMQALQADEGSLFLEIGPDCDLLRMAMERLPDSTSVWLPSLRRDMGNWTTLLGSLAQLYVNHISIDWKAFDAPYRRQKISLPPKPFQKQIFWPAALAAKNQLKLSVDVNQFLYEIIWQEQTLPIAPPIQVAESWLIVDKENSAADPLKQLMEQVGYRVMEASPSKSDNAKDKAAYVSLIADIASQGHLHGIAYCADDPEDFLYLMQAVIHSALSPLPAIWIISKALQPIANRPMEMASSLMCGMKKTLSLEYPGLYVCQLTLDPTLDRECASQLIAAEIANKPIDEQQMAEDLIVYRENKRYVARLLRKSDADRQNLLSTLPPINIDPEASYMITGGLGGLGLQVAEWLVGQGARHLCLVGRRAPNKMAMGAIDQLTEHGAQITVHHCDISDPHSTNLLVAQFDNELPPLRGVIHAAGILDDALFVDQTWSRFESVLAPKAIGAWNLHSATQALSLDFFVLFSSVAAALGNPGQSNYAAANCYLDALAHYRRQIGLPALSINWGPWAEVGMAAHLTDRHANSGLMPLKPEQALEAFGAILSTTAAQLVIASVNWQQFTEKAMVKIPLLSSLMAPSSAHEPQFKLLSQLKEATPQTQSALLSAFVRNLVCKVIGVADVSQLNDQKGFAELGMDSLMSMELKSRLQHELGTEYAVSPTVAFDYPTVKALTGYLESLLTLKELPIATFEDSPHPQAGLEEIAIIGMGCRFPGGANSPEEYWQILHGGIDAISNIPTDRWDVEHYYDSDPNAIGKMYCRQGGFLNTPIGHFDAKFFGISPKEAEWMDPQQRLLLELIWEALENAAIDPQQLFGTSTAVFIGCGNHDYESVLMNNSGDEISPYFGSGNSPSVLAGRISYFLGTQGPAMVIDTACSSSLVALHSACASLQSHGSDVALAGGVSLMLSPTITINCCQAKMLSPDGHCKTFDAKADGYARGEGAGLVILKRLSDAIKAGDTILAVIKASSINQDGASSGLTVPNGEAQKALIRGALAKADLQPHHINYIEAHGTGTSLGDPIEVRALGEVLGHNRTAENPLIIGSAKTNIGHLEAAAGIAGVIKLVLALQHEEIPPHRNFDTLNPLITLDTIPAIIPLEAHAWRRQPNRSRVAAISSFGFSGTNAHAIIEEPPAIEAHDNPFERPQHLIALSAKSSAALNELKLKYIEFLSGNLKLPLADIAYTANAGRHHFAKRIAFIARSTEELLVQMRSDEPYSGKADINQVPKVTFLFTGQGSEYCGMGKQLYDTQPLFRKTIEECSELLAPQLDLPLKALLFEQSNLPNQTAYTQPALFALEYALAVLWQSFGITPTYLVGHSFGEYAAAAIAGVMSLADAIKLVAARATLLETVSTTGTMAALFTDFQTVQSLNNQHQLELDIAAINAPQQVVVAGPLDQIHKAIEICAKANIKAQELPVSHAYHSKFMEPMLNAFRSVAESVAYHPPQIDIISNLTGRKIGKETINAEYWVQKVRQPVQFYGCMQTLQAEKCHLFVEIGPQPILCGLGMQCLSDPENRWLPSLRCGVDDWSILLNSLANLYVQGLPIDWKGFDAPYQRKKITLPTYPFQRERFWIKAKDEGAAVSLPTDWYYQLQWQKVAGSPAPQESDYSLSQPRAWVILAGANSLLADQLREKLKAMGCQVTQFTWDEALSIAEWLPTHPLEGILQCFDHLPQSDVLQQTETACQSIISLHQLFKEQGINPRWAAITLQGQGEVPDSHDLKGESAIQSAIGGLFKTLQIEAPEYRGILIDADAASSETCEQIIRLLFLGGSENFWALRRGVAYVPKVVSVKPPQRSEIGFKIQSEGRYLITGGLGGIGFAIAGWLVKQGCKQLTLIGRHEPDAHRAKELAEWQKLGVSIELSIIDIADPQAVSQLFISQSGKAPLKGIFHAAGIDRHCQLEAETQENLQAVLKAKVAGGWNLHTAIQGLDLDFVVYFSSVAALLGSPRQGPYSAANSFLDGLAAFQRQQGVQALNIQWGLWAEIGLGAHLKEMQGTIKPAIGIDTLQQLLATPPQTIAVVSPYTLRFMLDFAPEPLSGYLGRLATSLSSKAKLSPHGNDSTAWQREMNNLPQEERSSAICEMILQCVAEVMGFADTSEIDKESGFFDLGLDSIMAVVLKSTLERATGLSLNASIVFDYPTVSSLAVALAKRYTENHHVEVRNEFHSRGEEEIAVIGMSCVFPGAKDVDDFWKLLDEGREGLGEIPQSRWLNENYYDPDPDASGKSYVNHASFIEGIELFDASFFNISPKEAELMDPQQRLFLEHSWKALENANIAPDSLRNSRTGVFAGVAPSEYGKLLEKNMDEGDLNGYVATGNALNAIPGRLSFALGLRGPCLAIDTACSSALVAIHQACQSLQNGECQLAIAGGVNVMLQPTSFIVLSKAKMLAADGRCKTFDAAANGYGRGEGCGTIILKRLSDAQKDNNCILAVIKASGINQDGASSGLTVPNGDAQESLFREVSSRAGIDPQSIDYVEAHGTGTSLGDPIEVDAIGRVYGVGRDTPLVIGTVKTNIGHLEAAAGIAGVIKTILSMNHEVIPKHLHFKQLNPHIDLAAIDAEIPLEAKSWSHADSRKRRAAINSFGFSGTNAHLIIEEWQQPQAPAEGLLMPTRDVPQLFAVSAKTAEALQAYLKEYIPFLENSSATLEEICYAAVTSRTHFNHRVALVALDKGDLQRQINDRLLALNVSQPAIDQPIILHSSLALSKAENQRQFLESTAKLYEKGSKIDWRSIYVDDKKMATPTALPTYPFQKLRFWSKAINAKDQSKEIPDPAELLYEIIWQEQPQHTSFQVKGLSKRWLLVGQQSSLVHELKLLMEAAGHHTIELSLGESEKSTAPGCKMVNPTNKAEFTSLMDTIAAEGGLQGIVYCAESAEGFLYMMQAVIQAHMAQPPAVWIVSADLQPVGNRPIEIASSPLIGMKKTLSLEYPEICFYQLDLDPALGSAHNSRLILAEIDNSSADEREMKEDFIAYRDNKRYVPRLLRKQAINDARTSSCRPPFLNNESSYLITGGLGGLGLKVAEWLISQGANHLCLVGRKAPHAAALNTIERLKEQGSTIITEQCDISNLQNVELLINDFGKKHPPLKGLIHAAGVVDDALFIDQTWNRFEGVFTSKVSGALHLHNATKTLPLDFFVLFSSIASILGSPGQCNYAAANSYLDALAHYRKELGLPAVSINWGPWAEVGMAAELTGRHSASGVMPLKPERALEAFATILKSDLSQVLVASINWERFIQKIPIPLSLLNSLSPHLPNKEPHIDILNVLNGAEPFERNRLLREYIRNVVCKVIGLTNVEALSDEQGFAELGMDSLMTMEFRNQLQRDIGPTHTISPTAAFDYPTIERLTAHLLQLLGFGASRTYDEEICQSDRDDQSIAEMIDELETLLKDGEHDE